MSEWIEHDGKKCPVPEEAIVQIKIRSGAISDPEPAKSWTWTSSRKSRNRYDIIAYRIVEEEA